MHRFDVDEFIDQCRSALTETNGQLAVRDVVARAVSEPSQIESELGSHDSWRIEKLHHAPDMTILHFVWPPTLDLFPHEHKMWSTVGIYGGLEDNTMYRRTADGIEVAGHKQGREGDVLLLGVDGIHAVQNTTKSWTAAIHVYGGDFFDTPRLQWDKNTGESEPFDVGNARRELANAEAHARTEGLLSS